MRNLGGNGGWLRSCVLLVIGSSRVKALVVVLLLAIVLQGAASCTIREVVLYKTVNNPEPQPT